MIHVPSVRPGPIELTSDPRFTPRIRRLAMISAIALGIVWALATWTLDAPWPVSGLLAAGWLLMPVTLVTSLTRPRVRLALVVPASLVSLGLLAIVLFWRPADPVAATGWLLVTAGVLLGGGLGSWLWYRLAPVPSTLEDPFSPGRWALIAVHAGLVIAGVMLLAAALSSG